MRQIPFTTGLAALILAMAVAWDPPPPPPPPPSPLDAASGTRVLRCVLTERADSVGTIALAGAEERHRAAAVGYWLYLEVPDEAPDGAEATVWLDGGRTSATVEIGSDGCDRRVRLEPSARVDFVTKGGTRTIRACDQVLTVKQIATLWLPPSRLAEGCTIVTLGDELKLGPEHDGRTFWFGPVAPSGSQAAWVSQPPSPRPYGDVGAALWPAYSNKLRVFDDGPAAGAGLRTGDLVLRVGGHDVKLDRLEARRQLSSGADPQVVVDVVRRGPGGRLEELSFTVERPLARNP